MNHGLLTLSIVALLTIANCMQLRTQTPATNPLILSRRATFTFVLDDEVHRIAINENELKLPFAVGGWNVVKTIQMNLKKGDVISITGRNIGSNSFAGLMGTLTIINAHGDEMIFHTGENWICGGKPAVLIKEGVLSYAQISSNAKFIWDTTERSLRTVICSFKVPSI